MRLLVYVTGVILHTELVTTGDSLRNHLFDYSFIRAVWLCSENKFHPVAVCLLTLSHDTPMF